MSLCEQFINSLKGQHTLVLPQGFTNADGRECKGSFVEKDLVAQALGLLPPGSCRPGSLGKPGSQGRPEPAAQEGSAGQAGTATEHEQSGEEGKSGGRASGGAHVEVTEADHSSPYAKFFTILDRFPVQNRFPSLCGIIT